MYSVSRLPYFRPWKRAKSAECTDLSRSAGTSATIDNDTTDHQGDPRVCVKCEKATTDGEDNDTGSSPRSSPGSENGNNAQDRRPSAASSSSVNSSVDSPEPGSLDRLSNFVFGRGSNIEGNRETIGNSFLNSVSPSSSDDNSPLSAFTPTNYQYPLYPAYRYFPTLGMPTNNNAVVAAAVAASFQAYGHTYPHYHHHHHHQQQQQVPSQLPAQIPSQLPAQIPSQLPAQIPSQLPAQIPSQLPAQMTSQLPAQMPPQLPAQILPQHHNHHPQQTYGLPGISLGSYTSSVEEAVKYLHEQDAAAKQMKKLRPKKFRCEHCNVAFSNNGQLKGHIRIHTGERPFKCDTEGCGKSFTRNEELTRHKRIHTGVRPHSCLLCGKRFGRKDHLKKHTRTHDNRAAYHMPAPPSLAPYALPHHPIPPVHPMVPYMYPM